MTAGGLSLALFFTACSQGEEKLVSETKVNSVETVAPKKEEPTQKAPSPIVEEVSVNKVFLNPSVIQSHGKNMMIVFGTAQDPYTNKMKEDINGNKNIAELIKGMSAYYIDINDPREIQIEHQGQLKPANAVILRDIYQIAATPTMVFKDKSSRKMFVIPGRLQPNVFTEVLKFVNDESVPVKNLNTLRAHLEKLGLTKK